MNIDVGITLTPVLFSYGLVDYNYEAYSGLTLFVLTLIFISTIDKKGDIVINIFT
jgi:hypothetical protein